MPCKCGACTGTDKVGVVEVGPDHWEVHVDDNLNGPDVVTCFIEQDEAGARETETWLRQLYPKEA